MKSRWIWIGVLVLGLVTAVSSLQALAQEEAAPAEAAPAGGLELAADAAGDGEEPASTGFMAVVMSGGFMGVILWLSLLACSLAGVALIVDSFITIKSRKIVPESLVTKVKEAMEQGDVMKAIKECEEEPGPLANILTAGFGNVEEGFEVVQEAVGVAADLESEKLLQRINYMNVVGNLAPMLGLLGTVQGMIYAFATLGTSAGAAKQALLALNISQALYTTAAGLCVAIPAVGFFFYFRNRAMNIILGMEALTLDLIKVLRNVEVVEN